MLDAMLADILDVPGVKVFTTRDPRLSPLTQPVTAFDIDGSDIWAVWQQCVAEADAVWAVAPESAGVLESFARMAQDKWLGCSPDAIRVTASKRATALHLTEHNIQAVPTLLPEDWIGQTGKKWVAKPDDGVGCDDMRVFDDANALQVWLNNGRMNSHVVQPWLEGEAASLSILCRNGRAQLLSCNRQLIDLDGSIHYRGSRLNGMSSHWVVLEEMAMQIAAALPGLAGYVGVDVVVHQNRPTVIEINPRLTTSYAGLRHAIGWNPAELVLDLHYNDRFIEMGRLQRNVVEVNVDD